LIDISSEKLLSLAQAAEKLQVSKASITRWIIHGTHGVRLEALKFGAYWRTSEAALQRFGECQTPTLDPVYTPSSRHKSAPQPSLKRQREIDRSVEELERRLGVRKCESCRRILDAGYVSLPKDEKLWCPKCLVQRRFVSMGQRVLTFRRDAKLSHAALSKLCRISTDFIRSFEANSKKPSEAQLANLVEVLGDSFLVGLEQKSEPNSNTSSEV